LRIRPEHEVASVISRLADLKPVLGDEHPDTLATPTTSPPPTTPPDALGRRIAIYEPLLTDCERILGPTHPHTLVTCESLASAYRAAGRERGGRRSLRGPRSTRRSITGPLENADLSRPTHRGYCVPLSLAAWVASSATFVCIDVRCFLDRAVR
jgi:hypothetical protein